MPPTIIFVHGLGLSGEVWTPQLDWCKKNKIPFVAVTLPGHGNRKNEKVPLDKIVDELIQIARKHKQIIFVGHSFGAWLCCLAAPQLTNILSMIFVNPLIDIKQIKQPFFVAVKLAMLSQRFIAPRDGSFIRGGSFFWRFGIYPSCLYFNKMDVINTIIRDAAKKKSVILPTTIHCRVICSQYDELLSLADIQKEIVPFTGHMLFRIAPDIINGVLMEECERLLEHRV